MTIAPLTIFIAHPSELLTDHVPHGDGLVAFSFLRRLAERGHRLHVAAEQVDLRQPPPPNLLLYPLSPRHRAAVTDRFAFMLRMRLLFEQLRRTVAFDLIHQMNPVFTGVSLVLAGVRTPLVLGTFVPTWERDADSAAPAASRGGALRGAVRTRIARLQQAQAAGLLVATPRAVERIARPDDHRGRIYEVPHGIDLSQFVERADLPETPSILFLAGVARRKGIFTLLEAYARVRQAMPAARLTIAGHDGGDLAEARAMAAAIDGHVVFVGGVARADVPRWMRAHSVYCLPSYGEPFATTVLEAMACGVPVVATRAGGIPDLVSNAGGRLVAPRDPAALAAALTEVLASVHLQRAMGRHNRHRVETVFDAERAVDRLEEAYRAILEYSARPARAARARGPVRHRASRWKVAP